MRWQRGISAFACCAALGVVAPTMAQQPERETPRDTPQAAPSQVREQQPVRDRHQARDADGRILAAQTFRSTNLTGMNVRNMQGEVLGTIHDLVVDVRTGKIEYAAMSVGGVFGIGDKLLAIPFKEMKFNHGEDETFFVLDMSEEKIAAAPGFDQRNWPNFADPNWSDQIDKHFRDVETRTGETRTDDTRPGAPRADDPR